MTFFTKLLATAFIVFLGIAETNPARAYKSVFGEFSQNMDGVKYTLKMKIKDVNGNEQLHTYSVFRNGETVPNLDNGKTVKNFQRAEQVSGRLVGCRSWGPKGGLKDYLNAESVVNNMSMVIWKIEVQSWCGSTGSSTTERYIVVGETGGYREHEVTLKEYVTTVRTDKDLRIYYEEQIYGHGGTGVYQSALVPRKYTIKSNDFSDYSKNLNQISLQELLNIPWYLNETTGKRETGVSFIFIFHTCLRQRTPELCDYALEKAFKDKHIDYYQSYFGWEDREKSQIKKELLKLADEVRDEKIS